MCRTGTSPEDGAWQPRHCWIVGDDIREKFRGGRSTGEFGSVIQSNSHVYSSTTPAASSSGVISSKVFSLRVFSELYSEPNA